MMKGIFFKISIIKLIFVITIFASCNQKPTESKENNHEVDLKIPDFNADSAYTYIAQQVAFGPRTIGSKSHQKCEQYLVSFFKKYASNVIVQQGVAEAYNGKDIQLQNIIAEFNPEKSGRIFLAAHWDSRPFADESDDPSKRKKPIDGANDGASGVGILMEIARQLSVNNSSQGIDIILFDAEDFGTPEFLDEEQKTDTWCLGSQYWSKNQHRNNYSAQFGILLDMVGAKNALFHQEQFSIEYARGIVEKVWKTASDVGFSDRFVFEKGTTVIDDHLYINRLAKIPCIDIIEFDVTTESGFGSYWHTENDNLSVIDKSSLKAVGQTLLAVIYKENH